MSHCVIYGGSHRKGGNSDRAAELLCQGVDQAGGNAVTLFVRDYDIRPCLACGFCDTHPDKQGQDRCVLGHKDQAWELFAPLLTARCVLFASPIYFYHLPSRLKTWLDRGQQFWKAHENGEPWLDLPSRTAHAVLVAGQPSGNKLFEGARLTLKYFLQNFNMLLADPLPVLGVDAPDDLAGQADTEAAIIALGRRAWETSA